MPSKALILLTLNEITGSKYLYNKIPYSDFDRVILVDGGSTDGTIEFWKEKGIEVVNQRSPGRGTAFIIAQDFCNEDILVFFSPDGNEDPKDILNIVAQLEKGADLVIASRFSKQSTSLDATGHRLFGNLFFTILIRLFFRVQVTDAVNGFRGIWRKKMMAMHLPYSRFEIEFQMTIRAGKLNYKVVEIPTIEYERVGGESKAKSISVGVSYFKTIFKEILIGRRFLQSK